MKRRQSALMACSSASSCSVQDPSGFDHKWRLYQLEMPVQGGMLYTGGSGHGSPGSVPVTHARSRARRESEAGNGARGYEPWDYLLMLLRVLAIALTVASLMLMLDAKQTVTISFLGKFEVTKTADYKNVRAFRALVWTEGAVTGVMLLLLLIHLGAKDLVWTSLLLRCLVYFLDQAATYAMVAMASATAEVAWIAKRGEGVPQWRPTCPKFGKFCNQVGVSLGLAFAAALVLIQITLITAFRPTYRHHHRNAMPPAAAADPRNHKPVAIQQAGPQAV